MNATAWLDPAIIKPPRDKIVFVELRITSEIVTVTLARYYGRGSDDNWESALDWDSGSEGYEDILPSKIVIGWLPLIWPQAGPTETKGE